jgi:signal transduction histidine kinase
MDTGNLPLEVDRVDLAHLVGAAVRFVEDRARARGIDLTVAVDPDLACDADPRRLKQVLINLLANAVKFTPEGGKVAIAADRTDDGIEIRVADTGPGIAAEDLERVLQPFVQADGRLERLHEGTGLGLPLSRAIAEAHGGTLHLESPPGGGTTAVVRLPG